MIDIITGDASDVVWEVIVWECTSNYTFAFLTPFTVDLGLRLHAGRLGLWRAEYRELTEEPGWGDFKGRIDAPFGEEFIVRSPNEPFYVIAGMMILTMGRSGTDNAYFPGGLKANIRPGDKAVYIGTIRYHRDEFFEITDAEIVDEYDRVKAEFEELLGNTFPLRKALLSPVP